MRALALLGLLVASSPSGPEEPPVDESLALGLPSEPPPPPRKTGTGLLIWGSAGVVIGTGAIGGGLLTWVMLGHTGIIGTIPMAFGAGFIGLGAAGIHVGRRRRAALLRWQDEVGMSLADWRQRYQADRPGSGVALLSAGALSLSAGLCLGGIGFAELPPLATYEPGDNRSAVWLSVTGTIGMSVGATMLVMGSIQHHRHRRWPTTKPRLRGEATAFPWLTRDAIGLGLVGRF